MEAMIWCSVKLNRANWLADETWLMSFCFLWLLGASVTAETWGVWSEWIRDYFKSIDDSNTNVMCLCAWTFHCVWCMGERNKQLTRPSWMHVDLKSDGDWLREGHARITLGLFVRSLRILPLLAQLANYVLKWRLDSMRNCLERVNWLPEEKCLTSACPLPVYWTLGAREAAVSWGNGSGGSKEWMNLLLDVEISIGSMYQSSCVRISS